MSTPTKFSLGGVPRSRTGLVPTSYSQTADKLATSQYYENLPTQPSKAKYKYRGDYINERNRKLLHERKLAQKQRSFDSVGSTLLVSPRSSINNASIEKENKPVNTKKWDSYCQHISANKLSENEELSKLQNRKKFVSYLRKEASKRSPKKKEEKKDPIETSVRKRKPRVPRLSRLARSGKKDIADKDKRQTTTSPPTEIAEDEGQANKTETKDTAAAKSKVRYLDFISSKKSPPRFDECDANKSKSGIKDDTSKPLANSDDDDDDDESKFRAQIERIVERAAEMCIPQNGSSDENASADVINTTITTSPDMIDNSTKTTSADDAPSKKDNLLSNQQRVAILEKQVKSVTSSSDSVVTEIETHVGDSNTYSTSTATEVPRSQVKPMLWQQKSMVDLLNGIDSNSSYTSSSYFTNTELDSTSGFTDMISSDVTMPVIDEIKSCDETMTEVKPRVQSIRQSQTIEKQQLQLPSLDECPEINNLSQVHPSAEPSRENLFDDVPLPRGCELRGQGCEDSLFSFVDIYPKTAQTESHLLHDICSLLG